MIVDKLETVLIRCSVIGTMVMMDKFKDKDCKIELCPAFIVVESVKTIFNEATQIIKVNIVAFVVLVAILFIINQPNFSRIMLFLLAFVYV